MLFIMSVCNRVGRYSYILFISISLVVGYKSTFRDKHQIKNWRHKINNMILCVSIEENKIYYRLQVLCLLTLLYKITAYYEPYKYEISPSFEIIISSSYIHMFYYNSTWYYNFLKFNESTFLLTIWSNQIWAKLSIYGCLKSP